MLNTLVQRHAEGQDFDDDGACPNRGKDWRLVVDDAGLNHWRIIHMI